MDQKDEFLRLIEDPEFRQEPRQFTRKIFYSDALDIATAVFNGETKGIINPEDILYPEMTPLHHAAAMSAPKITKFLLERGDNLDVRCDYSRMNLKQVTPLDLALESVTLHAERRAWNPRMSIFELLVHVCWKTHGLEVIRLLVQYTASKELVWQAFIDNAYKGQLVHLTALFLAAPESFLTSYFISLRGGLPPFGMLDFALNSLKKNTEIKEGLSLLLDVFSMAGDKLVAYIRLEDRDISERVSEISFFLREVAQKKLGESSCDDYFLRFFKPVKPEADQLESYPRYTSEYQKKTLQVERDNACIVSFYMKRKDITIDFINRKTPILQPEDAAVLHRVIENKLSSMSTLHCLFETVARISMKGEKHLLRWYPFPLGLNFEPSLRSFPTIMASAKQRSDFKFTLSNRLVNEVIQQTKLKSFMSFVKLSHIPMIVKRLIK